MTRPIGLTVLALSAALAPTARADFTVWVDETKTGYYRVSNGPDNGPIVKLGTTSVLDNTSTDINDKGPINANVPAFILPAATFGTISPGDLVVSEVTNANPAYSDLIRFTTTKDAQGNTIQVMLFYSDRQPSLPEPNPPASDVGVPSEKDWQTPNFPIQESGTEPVNNFSWTPSLQGSTIGASSLGSITYLVYSDGLVPVPEPSAWVLCGLGIGLLGLSARWKRPRG